MMDLLYAFDESQAREMLHDLGCTDGLPVIVPTQERVDEMLAGAPFIAPDEVIAVVPPRMGRFGASPGAGGGSGFALPLGDRDRLSDVRTDEKLAPFAR